MNLAVDADSLTLLQSSALCAINKLSHKSCVVVPMATELLPLPPSEMLLLALRQLSPSGQRTPCQGQFEIPPVSVSGCVAVTVLRGPLALVWAPFSPANMG